MTFSEELINILEYLGGKIGVTIDWASTTMVPYLTELCEKIISYEIWTSVFWMVFMWACAICLWIPATICWVRGHKQKWDLTDSGDLEALMIIVIIVACVWSLFSIIVTGVQAYDIIEAAYFPEKTIYEFITNAIQSAKGGY